MTQCICWLAGRQGHSLDCAVPHGMDIPVLLSAFIAGLNSSQEVPCLVQEQKQPSLFTSLNCH